MPKFIVTSLLATSLSLPILAVSPDRSFAQSALTPTLIVVHGIEGGDLGAGILPSLPVDLQIDGACLSKQPLEFANVVGPYPLAAGAHSVVVSHANTTKPCANPAIISKTVTLSTSQQAALVLAESTAGTPAAELFTLPQATPVPVGVALVDVFHTANAPAVDVTVTDNHSGAVSTLSNLQPGDSAQGDFTPFVSYAVSVLPHGSTTSVAGPVFLNPANRALELLFVVGNATNGSVQVISKEIYGAF